MASFQRHGKLALERWLDQPSEVKEGEVMKGVILAGGAGNSLYPRASLSTPTMRSQ